MALASQTVDAIFRRLLARYGSAWNAKWAGVPEEDVKTDWANVLGRFSREAVLYALEYLPEFPPTAGQFREICIRAPQREPEQQLLDAPKPDPARLAAELERLHQMLKDRAPKQWAYDLQEKERSGERLTEVQRQAWREALASNELPLNLGSYTFQQEELPPGMRTREVDPADVAKLEAYTREKLYARRRNNLDLHSMTPREITQALRESGDIPAPDGYAPRREAA